MLGGIYDKELEARSEQAPIVVTRSTLIACVALLVFRRCKPEQSVSVWTSAIRMRADLLCSAGVFRILTHLYGPAVRCKWFRPSWR
jgi:hypothetical protein